MRRHTRGYDSKELCRTYEGARLRTQKLETGRDQWQTDVAHRPRIRIATDVSGVAVVVGAIKAQHAQVWKSCERSKRLQLANVETQVAQR